MIVTDFNPDATTNLAELRNDAAVFSRLSIYCTLRIVAIGHRLEGRVATAVTIETEMENIYKLLPKEARW